MTISPSLTPSGFHLWATLYDTRGAAIDRTICHVPTAPWSVRADSPAANVYLVGRPVRPAYRPDACVGPGVVAVPRPQRHRDRAGRRLSDRVRPVSQPEVAFGGPAGQVVARAEPPARVPDRVRRGCAGHPVLRPRDRPCAVGAA